MDPSEKGDRMALLILWPLNLNHGDAEHSWSPGMTADWEFVVDDKVAAFDLQVEVSLLFLLLQNQRTTTYWPVPAY